MAQEVAGESVDRTAGRDEIGGWVLVRELSRGGMGQVWKVIRETGVGESKLGALKLPLTAVVTDPTRVEGFKAEARLTMKLDHPNIVKTLDAGVDRGIPFMVMEWVNGVDLAQFMKILRKSAPLAFDVAIHIFSELVLALRYAHSRRIAGQTLGIIHRDIKPSNVMISSDGAVLLTDFGIASVAGEPSSENIRGTLRYMAPEHWMGRPSQRSDLYALGLILTELLDGRVVYHGLSQEEMIQKKMTGKIPSCRRADVPAQIEAIRVGLLQVDESKRIQSADDVLSLLELAPPFRKATTQLQKLFALLFADTAARSGYTEVLRPGQPSTRISPELAAMFAAVEAMRIQGMDPDPELVDAVSERVAAELPGSTSDPLDVVFVVEPPPPGRDPDAPVFFRRRPRQAGDPPPPEAAPPDRTIAHGEGATQTRVPTERWAPEPVVPANPERTPVVPPALPVRSGATAPSRAAEPNTAPAPVAADPGRDDVTTSTWQAPLPTRARWLALRSNRIIWIAVAIAAVVLAASILGRTIIASGDTQPQPAGPDTE